MPPSQPELATDFPESAAVLPAQHGAVPPSMHSRASSVCVLGRRLTWERKGAMMPMLLQGSPADLWAASKDTTTAASPALL